MIGLLTRSLLSDAELLPSNLVRRLAHSLHDLVTRQFARMVAHETGLEENGFEEMLGNSRDLISSIL